MNIISTLMTNQVNTLKAVIEKQKQNNATFQQQTTEHNQKSSEIATLEAQLEQLANQGKELGAKIDKGNVTDGKTLDEIKSLLTQQVQTITDLANRQKAINDKYEKDSASYKASVADTTKLASSLAEEVKALQSLKGVTVKQGTTVSGKSWDEIKAGLQAKIDEAKTLKTKQSNAIDADKSAQASYLKLVQQYNKELEQYNNVDKPKYQREKEKYDRELEQYEKVDKPKYLREKDEYDKAIQNAQANVNTLGWLSEVSSQSLNFQSEPNARVSSITGTTSFIRKNAFDAGSNEDARFTFRYSSSDYTNQNNGNIFVLNVGQTATVSYEGLQNSTYKGKKITKAVFNYTLLNSDNGKTIFRAFDDPTTTIQFASGYGFKGRGENVKAELTLYYADGSKVVYDKDNPALFGNFSLNSLGEGGYYEYVEGLTSNEKFIRFAGSPVQDYNGKAYSKLSIDTTPPYSEHESKNRFYGGIVTQVNSGDKYTVVIGSSSGATRHWHAINTNLFSPVVVKPVEPEEPKEPKEPKAPTPPEKDKTQAENVEFTYNLYELPAQPTKETLSGTYSNFLLPKEPVKKNETATTEKADKPNAPVKKNETTKVDEYEVPNAPDKKVEVGTFNEFTSPEKPVKPIYGYHLNTLQTVQDGQKAVVDTDNSDINGHVVPKSSTVKFDLKVSRLPAHREPTKNFSITDPLPVKYDEEATKKLENNKNWDIVYDKEGNTVTFTPTSKYIGEWNKDRTKAYDIQYPSVVGQAENDDAVYENNFTVKHNDNTYRSNIVTVTTPIPPTITTDEKGNKKENPLKSVKDDKGNDINSLNVKEEGTFKYDLTWGNKGYKGVVASAKELADGFFYVEDIDENAVEPLLDKLKVTEKGTDKVVEGVKAEYYESLEKAPKEVQEKYKTQNISPKGGFVHIYVEDKFNKEHNDKYKVTGIDLNIEFPVKVKKGFTGKFENTAYQSDYGNGYRTNTVSNNIPVQSTEKYVSVDSEVDVTKLTDKDKATEVKNRKENYNWIVKNTLDEYSVQNHLYTELSLTDSSFADIQTADRVELKDSKGKDVTNEVDIQVWVDGKLYSVNGNLSNETIAKATTEKPQEASEAKEVQDGTNVKQESKTPETDPIKADGGQTKGLDKGDLKTNDKKLQSKDKNLLLPDSLDQDGKKGSVEIKAVFKKPTEVSDKTYYTVYRGVNTKKASTGEMKNYLTDGDKLVVDNKARIEYKFKFDEDWNKTKESEAKVSIPVHSPKDATANKYVTKGDVDVTKLTDKDKVTDLANLTDTYNWIIEANLDKNAVNSGTYQSLSIVDKEFADIQSATKATVRTPDNKDVTSLVDIQVWQDGKLYSINGKKVGVDSAKTEQAEKSGTVETAESATVKESGNLLLPEGLNKDGKKGSVQIKAVFKSPELVEESKYFLAIEGVNYKDSSTEEKKLYSDGKEIKVGNVANVEYQGIFDKEKKTSKDVTSEVKTPIPDTTAKVTKYAQKDTVDVSKLGDANTSLELEKEIKKYNWIVKAELNKDAVNGGFYDSLFISDSKFADLQSVASAKVLNSKGEDVTNLVDIQVNKDGKLYSVNGKEISATGTANSSASTTPQNSSTNTKDTATKTTSQQVQNIGDGSFPDDVKEKINKKVDELLNRLIASGKTDKVDKDTVNKALRKEMETLLNDDKFTGKEVVVAEVTKKAPEAIEKSDLTPEQKQALTKAYNDTLSKTNSKQVDTQTSSNQLQSSNVLLPKGLDKDGKKGSVEIKAIFKDGKTIKDDTYYLVLEGVSYSNASKEEVANYVSNGRVVIENLAKAEYKGVFDEKAKETNEAKAEVRQDDDKPDTPVEKTFQKLEDFAKTGMRKETGFGLIALALAGLGLWGWKKRKDSQNES